MLVFTLPAIANNPVIVIDAGHGGKSPGAVYNNICEKDINLKVALLAAQKLKALLPNAQIIQTRSTDIDVSLNERSRIANAAKADLFISIHCNANPSTAVSGSETYLMGVDKSGANLEVAMAENSVIQLEEGFEQAYGGYDPKSAESFIIFSLMQYAHSEQSFSFASLLQKQFAAATTMKNLGVKQAGFLVLWRTAMPSVLTEIGFLSNAADRAIITSKNGQTKIAEAIAHAANTFVTKLDQNSKPTQNPTPQPQTKPQATPKQPSQNTQNQTIRYRIQVKSTKTPTEINSQNFGPWVSVVTTKKVANIHKYYIGNELSYQEALSLQHKLRPLFRDCFITAFDAEQQITLEKAKQQLEK